MKRLWLLLILLFSLVAPFFSSEQKIVYKEISATDISNALFFFAFDWAKVHDDKPPVIDTYGVGA